MTLFNLVTRNMKRNAKNYLLYFISLIFCIAIYYTFVSLQYNSQVLKQSQLSGSMSYAFSFSSWLIILFVAVFAVYSNSFFTRKRKQEVGLYSLLGVRRKQIGMMLFFENMFLSLGALLIGIAGGTLFSKLALTYLAYLMNLTITVSFEVPLQAVINTVLIFICLSLFTSVQSYLLIYRFKLIDLFKADQAGEKAPKGSLIMALISVILIGSAYYLSVNFMKFPDPIIALYIIGATVLGTYIFFHFFMVNYLKRARNNKKSIYKGLNMITKGQLLYRIKGHATSLATIAVLCTLTLCAIGTMATIYYNVGIKTKEMNPYSFSYEKKSDEFAGKVEQIFEKHSDEHKIVESNELPFLSVAGRFDLPEEHYLQFNGKDGYKLLSESKYNSNREKQGLQPIELNSDEMHMIFPYANESQWGSIKNQSILLTKGTKEAPVTKLRLVGIASERMSNLFFPILVVDDNVFEESKKIGTPYTIENVTINNQDNSLALSNEMKELTELENVAMNDYYSSYQLLKESSGLMIFIGGFIGLVFILATGSILYFKQLTEAHHDKKLYAIISKIGTTKRERKSAISKQVLFIFALPLGVGIIHSLFALNTMSMLFDMSITIPVLVTIVIFILIYTGYYFLTVRFYTKIVNEKQ
ncbi:ABC transporter permease [Brevibacillus daliensis]|uniref:ABC transporter permease n=1 Tax=Brevibacillus daliensis TaxID=2892995 RepID=UPI001E3573E1|nr:ABC transporter permease [Brevibacillus daliensis]